ncbi:MAG: hypothetical protein A4S09_03920 [Proteobacteria bacterium SG_bin7]|nr:MAG: hypothetical protein A4S09_03920 [Proteobacteria bacterium SG_bin7]
MNQDAELVTGVTPTSRRTLQLQYIGNWVWRAVASLVDTKEFDPSPKWIAKKINVNLEEVVDALEGLEKLGIIGRTPQGYKKLLKYVYFSDRDLNPKAVLADHVLISTQIMGRLNPANPNLGCFYRTGFVATNQELAKKYFTKMEAVMKEFLMESANAAADAVYAFTFSAVDVMDKTNKGGDQ